MSFLIKKLQPRQVLHACKVLGALQARYDTHWAPHFVPGPYPKTKEEREAAAKKYNLLPEEYEPYPDEEGLGDYPKLPYESVPTRDPNYPWDDEEMRRNFMDPVHNRIINLFPEQDPVDIPFKVVLKELVFFNLIPVAVLALVLYILNFVHFHHGNVKQYPKPGVVHYTFELDYGEPEVEETGVEEPGAEKIC